MIKLNPKIFKDDIEQNRRVLVLERAWCWREKKIKMLLLFALI